MQTLMNVRSDHTSNSRWIHWAILWKVNISNTTGLLTKLKGESLSPASRSVSILIQRMNRNSSTVRVLHIISWKMWYLWPHFPWFGHTYIPGTCIFVTWLTLKVCKNMSTNLRLSRVQKTAPGLINHEHLQKDNYVVYNVSMDDCDSCRV